MGIIFMHNLLTFLATWVEAGGLREKQERREEVQPDLSSNIFC